MRTKSIVLAVVCVVAFLMGAVAVSLKTQLDQEIQIQDATATANWAAARARIRDDHRRKTFTLFAVVPVEKTEPREVAGFEFRYVYSKTLADSDHKAAGAYYQHNNGLLFLFAAYQYDQVDRSAGLEILEMIAAVHPALSPSRPGFPPTSIHEIVRRLKIEDRNTEKFVKEESTEWQRLIGRESSGG